MRRLCLIKKRFLNLLCVLDVVVFQSLLEIVFFFPVFHIKQNFLFSQKDYHCASSPASSCLRGKRAVKRR